MVGKEVDHPALINVDNQDWGAETENDPEKCDTRAGMLFFQSVVKFKDTFTENLPLHVRNKVHSITVKTAFDNLPASGGSDDV